MHNATTILDQTTTIKVFFNERSFSLFSLFLFLKQITQIVHPSEITEGQPIETEKVGPEASDEKVGDESKLTETNLKSDQVENSPEELIEEKPNVDVSSNAEQINEKIESEFLPESTGADVEGEKMDTEISKEETSQGIEVAEEPCDKHIEQTTDESSIHEEEEATTQEENIVDKAPKEEAEVAQNLEESTEKQIDEEVKLHSRLKK
jgi:hypothetical protein